MSQEPFAPDTPITVKAGTLYEPFELDISHWNGRIVGQVQENDYLVRWDKPTIEAIPGWVVASWIETGEDWSCMELEAKNLQPATRPRDKEDDWFDAFCQRLNDHGITPNFLSSPTFVSEMNQFDDKMDIGFNEDDIAEFEDYEKWDYFDFEEFVDRLQIPPKQHKPLLAALKRSQKVYEQDNYFNRFSPQVFLEEHLIMPRAFGYALVSALNDSKLSRLTKVKLCQYTLDEMDPYDRGGIPYGLINMLAFLAREKMLVIPVFGLILFTLDYSRKGMFGHFNWLEDLNDKSELVDLLEWLLQQEEINDDELIWWFWRFATMCDKVHHSWGKALIATWCASEKSNATKKRLLHAWLEDGYQPAGTAPIAWQMTDAQQAGDIEKLLAIYEQAGITPTAEELALLQEQADLMQETIEENPFASIRQLMGRFELIPPYFKRASVVELVHMGESIDDLTDRYWNSNAEDTMTQQGIADALIAFHDQLDQEQIQDYVKQGIRHSSYQVRHAFHKVAVQLLGQQYLSQALKDDSKAVRNWAKKQAK